MGKGGGVRLCEYIHACTRTPARVSAYKCMIADAQSESHRGKTGEPLLNHEIRILRGIPARGETEWSCFRETSIAARSLDPHSNGEFAQKICSLQYVRCAMYIHCTKINTNWLVYVLLPILTKSHKILSSNS